MSDTPPLDQRSRRRLARTGIPQSIIRRDRASQPATASAAAAVAAELQPIIATARTKPDTTSDDSDDDDDDAPRTITTSVSVHTYGGELAKRARPCTSSSGGSDEQEDKRVKLTRLALPRPTEYRESPRSPSSPNQITPWVAIEIAPASTPLPPPTEDLPRREAPAAPSMPICANDGAESAMITSFRSHSTQSTSQHESASWRKDSTSYAGLASPTQHDVQMRPISPQATTSYATAAATPASPRCVPRPTTVPSQPAPTNHLQPTPRSAYPPLVVECLPHWTRHFQALGQLLGHAPNARPFGQGVRFLPKSAEEFRAVQRYMTEAAAQDSAISWYCYSPATEVPTKVAIRGLPLETPTDEIVAALCELGYPAEAARAIPSARGMHSCTYFVRLAHLTQEELQNLYATTELLLMPQVTIEAWRGGHKPPQCFRCQLYSHSSANCHRPIRCVRCAGEHFVRDCPRPRDEPPTCANCGQSHAANDRRCAHYKKEARRRGIAQPPPQPRGKQRQRQQQRATTASAQPTAHQRRDTRPNAYTGPDTTAPNKAALGVNAPSTTAPHAATSAPLPSETARTPAPQVTTTATRPTTLVADANPPTERGKAHGRRRRCNRASRTTATEPAAASTPQQWQPRTGTRDDEPVCPAPRPTPAPATAQRTVPATIAPPSTPSAHQQAQGEVQTNPDVMAIVRVVVEALMTGLTAYLQGQGALPALSAGMTVLTRLHSC